MSSGVRRELAWITGALALTSLVSGRPKLASSLGAFCLGLRLWPDRKFRYDGASVVVTGSSRGLGLALAADLLNRGARVTLLARDAEELERARARLEAGRETQVYAVACDVTEPEQVERALRLVEERFGRVDMWINNAGSISVGPFEAMDVRDFEAQLNLHLRAVVQATMRLVKHFKSRGGGRIVNISSIGGKLPVPHMGPYCASKFALGGFSEAIAAELAASGIVVTTVFPGLMRTGSPIQAVFKGDAPKEYAWFALSDNTPGLSLSAARAARKILDGAAEGRYELVIGWPAKLGAFGHANFPEIYGALMRAFARTLPSRHSHERWTGAQSCYWLEEKIWYRPLRWLARQQEKQWNQRPGNDPEFNLGRG